MSGLLLRPDSLYRATRYAEDPPALTGGGDGRMGWHGWDQHAALLLEIRNALAGPKHRLHGPPTGEAKPRPLTEIEQLQQLRRA